MGRKILWIDDEPEGLAAARALLEAQGHQVLVASEAEEGLRMAQTQSPDLILLDLLMPGRGGMGMLEEMEKLPGLATTPVLVVWPAFLGQDPREGGRVRKAPKASGSIEWPLDPGGLVSKIRALLDEGCARRNPGR